MAQGGGEVDRPRPAQHPDGQIAQGRHDAGAGAGADLGGVLGEGDVAEVVQRLDALVSPDEVGEAGRAGPGVREAGDRIDLDGPPPPGVQLPGLAGDLDDLGGVRKAEVVDRDHLEGAQLDAAMAAVAGAIQHGHALPGQVLAAVQQGRLVGLDDQQVVGLLVGDQELGGLRVGLQRIGSDHHIGQVEVGQQ
jgi:hypothetical protein